MAKVKIQGHASGTGILTVTAPNTSTDRTITLPDATGTLATTADVNAFDPDGAQVFNESGADVDFRVESDANTHGLFLEGSTGNVGIGSTPGDNKLHIYDTSSWQPQVVIENASTSATTPSQLQFYKSRGAGAGVSGDYLGQIAFNGDDDTSATETTFAYIWAKMDDASAASKDGSIHFSTMVANTDTEVLTLKGGKVGIGATSLSYPLTVKNNGDCTVAITASTSTTAAVNFGDTDAAHQGKIAYVNNGDYFYFSTDGYANERMRIGSTGDVRVGTTVEPQSGTDGVEIRPSGSLRMGASGTGGHNMFEFNNPNGNVGKIVSSGSSTAYNTSSDYRLKENVVPMTGSIDRLKELKPSKFNFIADADKTVDGFLAHEVSDYVPEAISGEKDAMRTAEYEVEPAVLDDDGEVVTEAVMGEREVIDPQGIDQSKLVPLLTGALQEAVAKIEELTTRIETLEAE